MTDLDPQLGRQLAQYGQALESLITDGHDNAMVLADEPSFSRPRRPALIGVCVLVMAASIGGGMVVAGRDDRAVGDEAQATGPSVDTTSSPPPASTDPQPTAASTPGSVTPVVADPLVAEPSVPSTDSAVGPGYVELNREFHEALNTGYRAVDAQTAPCMAAQGLDYLPTLLWEMPDRVVRPWNWPNGDEASTLGYRFPFDGNRPRTDSWDYGGIDIPSDPVSLRDAYEKAMYGEVVGIFETPPQPGDRPGKPQGGEIYDGCYATAIVDIVRLGDPAVAYDGFAYSMALQSIRRDGFKAVAGAPEFVAAESVWRDCMVARGFTPELLIFDRFETSSTAGPGEPNIDQIPLAIADWECKLAAQIPEIGERLFIDGTDAALRADPTLAEELHRYSTEIVAISQAMFSTSETAESGG